MLFFNVWVHLGSYLGSNLTAILREENYIFYKVSISGFLANTTFNKDFSAIINRKKYAYVYNF